MFDSFDFLWRWYAARCDGRWEHEFGVMIQTIDNPGWEVEIDLKGTPLQGKVFERVTSDKSNDDWLFCNVAEDKFIGRGDPSKLTEILRHFQSFAVSEAQ